MPIVGDPAVDDAGDQIVIRRQLKRRYVLAFFQRLPPCLVGIEACASSHHWRRFGLPIDWPRSLPPPFGLLPAIAHPDPPRLGRRRQHLRLARTRPRHQILSAEKDSAGPSGNRRCRPPPRTRCADPSPRRISDSEQSALGLISVLKHAAASLECRK